MADDTREIVQPEDDIAERHMSPDVELPAGVHGAVGRGEFTLTAASARQAGTLTRRFIRWPPGSRLARVS